MKRLMVYVVATAMVFTVFGFNPAEASAAVGKNNIAKVGSSSKSVSVGHKFDLEVQKGRNVKDSTLWWSIGNTGIVKFDDNDRSDDDIELRAVKAGTTKVSCKNKLTGGKITYTVTVKQPANYYIVKVGSATKTVEVGDDIDLQVSKGASLSSNKIKWSIADTSILRFENGDNLGTAVEVEALRTGATKVYVKNLHTGGQLSYTINVVPDYDD